MKNWLLIFILVVVVSLIISPKQIFSSGKIIIYMDESGFEPKSTTIIVGQTTTFENRGKEAHWPASNIHPTHAIYPEFDPKKEIAFKKSWSFVFDKAGIWRFHDHLNPQFGGAITVTRIAGTQAETSLVKKNLWQKISGFFSSLFSSKKIAEKPLYSPAPENSSLQQPQKSLAPQSKKQTTAFENIDKNSKEIWNNDIALYAYMKKYGATQTFAHLDQMEKQGVGDCHQTAHRAGHFGLQLFGNSVLKECNLSCHSGCYHGATEEYFKINGSENLSEGLNALCAASTENSFYNHQCLHGLGHGLMAWTNYDLPEALKTCDLLKTGSGSCWTGVFMENIVAGLATDKGDEHITAYKNDDPQYPCTIVDEKYKNSCYFLQTSRMIQMFGVNFQKIADACDVAPTQYKSSCFQSMGRDVSSVYRSTPAQSIKECGYSPKEYLIDCLDGAVQDALWDINGQDTAISFCKLLTDTGEKKSCYETIIARMRQVARNTEEKNIFCDKVENNFRSLCY